MTGRCRSSPVERTVFATRGRFFGTFRRFFLRRGRGAYKTFIFKDNGECGRNILKEIRDKVLTDAGEVAKTLRTKQFRRRIIQNTVSMSVDAIQNKLTSCQNAFHIIQNEINLGFFFG